jgi:hypothetical protein
VGSCGRLPAGLRLAGLRVATRLRLSGRGLAGLGLAGVRLAAVRLAGVRLAALRPAGVRLADVRLVRSRLAGLLGLSRRLPRLGRGRAVPLVGFVRGGGRMTAVALWIVLRGLVFWHRRFVCSQRLHVAYRRPSSRLEP